MSSMTIYKCDNCGSESKGSRHTRTVGIYVGSIDYSDFRKSEDWCEACIKKAGCVPPTRPKKEDPAPPPAPSLEDMIREVMRQEIQNLTGAC